MNATGVTATTRRSRLLRRVMAVTVLAVACLQACVPVRWNEAPGKPSSSARSQPSGGGAARRGARGNQPFYKVNGVRYRVLDSSLGYTERGVASWYGKKFHGRTTSSGEIYDMYGMTAAHKALPLPTRVRVRHLGNGKSVVVTVNDRGPFIHNRIIDLSYAAASELDMIGTGTALVEIVALAGPGTSPKPARTAVVPLMTELEPADMAVPPPAAAQQQPAASETRLYLQVGAFGDPINARQLRRQLQTKGLSNVVIRYDLGTSPTLYRVRLGPIADVAEYDALVELMAAMQIVETHLVTESGDAQLLDLATTMPAGAPDRVSVSGTLTDG